MRRTLYTCILLCSVLTPGFISKTWSKAVTPSDRNSVTRRGATVVAARPKLIVQIAVDQLRGDLLERYAPLFTGGFRRLRDTGWRYTNATVDHAPTNSYPGHVTLATGAFPSRHGIIDNSWAERNGDRLVAVDGAADRNERILGFPDLMGVSPNKLLVTGLADWFLKNDPLAQVVNISSGEYASLLHAGRTRGHTYWFSPEAGRYVTSTYYQRAYPSWVERFNGEMLPRFMAEKVWDCSVALKSRALAHRDAAPYEYDGIHTSFPHVFANEVPKDRLENPQAFADWFYFSPMIDEATLSLTQEAVRALALGQRGHTDYLSVVVSATDSIGHRYGPLSLEQLDNLLRLDRALGDFFKFLDRVVGRGQYVVALTADHGAAEIPEYQREMRKPGRRIKESEIGEMLKQVHTAVAAKPDTPREIAARVEELVEKYDFVAAVMSQDELAGTGQADQFVTLYRHSYHPARTPIYPLVSHGQPSLARYGVRVRLKEGALPYFAPSNHGSPYWYDRHVTLIFMGPGVPRGSSTLPARTVDVAPTLAHLGGITVPVEVDGRPLSFSRAKPPGRKKGG